MWSADHSLRNAVIDDFKILKASRNSALSQLYLPCPPNGLFNGAFIGKTTASYGKVIDEQ
jgi:hypothetical protein